ncbi:hypothetical protein ANN_16635 [Periplaneta americana]|uniref:Uncharacterized protein n=1 Tax=Periplaneta americana TaxID=6978 RepID=A0ABQ8SQX7_PERAM|nr:hypothetical protein ANN_16635 [Periplaneta americana]
MTSLMLHRCHTGAINLQSRHDSHRSFQQFCSLFRCNVTSLMPPDRGELDNIGHRVISDSAFLSSIIRWLFYDAFINILGYLASELDEGDNAGKTSPGSNTESYPAFAHIGLRENSGKNLDQVYCPHLWSNGQRVWPRNQVARVRIPVGESYPVEVFPGFSLNPIRANARSYLHRQRINERALLRSGRTVFTALRIGEELISIGHLAVQTSQSVTMRCGISSRALRHDTIDELKNDVRRAFQQITPAMLR